MCGLIEISETYFSKSIEFFRPNFSKSIDFLKYFSKSIELLTKSGFLQIYWFETVNL